MANISETRKPISVAERPKSAEKKEESLTPPDLNKKLLKMSLAYYTLKKMADEKNIRGQEIILIKVKMERIKNLVSEIKKNAEKKHYPVLGTSNYIGIKDRSSEFNKINFVYFLVNENNDQLTNEYGYMYLLGDYFLVAKIYDKANVGGGLSFFIDKNSGQLLNNKGYDEIKLIGKDKIIAKKGQKWYWICSNEKKYRMNLGSEMTNGHVQITYEDGYLRGLEHDLGNETILMPNSVRVDNPMSISNPPTNNKMVA